MSDSTDRLWWWHLILSTKRSWLPGDARGFRSREHRIHSSGDYKQRPPDDEHAGLRNTNEQYAAPVEIPRELRGVVVDAIHRKLDKQAYEVLVIAVGMHHAHLLVRLPDDYTSVKKVAGQLKQASSHAVREHLPGRLWADGGKPIRIRSRRHQLEVFEYIREHAKEGATVWCFKDGEG